MYKKNMFHKKNSRAVLSVLIAFILPMIAIVFSQACAWAGTTPTSVLVGKWGYTVLGHGAADGNGFFTWKTEAGTMQFTRSTMTVSYLESADICPSPEYCIPGETYTLPYTAVSNLDGTISVYGDPGPDQGMMRFAVSDDGKVAIIDGTNVEDNGQMLILAVKIGERTYGNGDADGDYYTIGYERDYLGFDSGFYRSATNLTTMNGDGTLSMVRVWNGDGVIHSPVDPQPGTYQVESGGSMLINGVATGYVTGDGKVAIFSNPALEGGAKDDFMSNIAVRKADKPYATNDVTGTWAITFFGDDAGEAFWSSFGIMTCESDGACVAPLKVNHSQQGLIDQTIQLPVTLSADGSYNGFFLTGNKPHYSGAIGKDGNVMVFALTPEWEDDLNNRRIAVAVKCTACADTSNPTLTVTTPLPRQKVLTTSIVVRGTATDLNRGDNGIAGIALKLNDNEPEVIDGATAVGGEELSWSKEVTLIQGKNVLTVTATDLEGNSTTETITFSCIADLTGPALKVKYPTKSIMSANILLSGTAVDKAGSGVNQVLVDGEPMLSSPVPDKMKAYWSTTLPLDLGENVILISAVDGLANVSERTIVITRIEDILPPVLKVASHRNNTHVTTASINLSGTATDKKKGNNGIERVTISLNGSDEEDVDSGGIADGAEMALWTSAVALDPGANTIVVKAYDTSGYNAGSSVTLIVYYDDL